VTQPNAQEVVSPLTAGLAEQHAIARDQLAAAWQLHVDKVKEQLEQGWREQIAQVLDERFAEVPTLVEAEIAHRVQQQVAEGLKQQIEELTRARGHARRQMSERLNQCVRRLDQAENREAWVAALLDGALSFASRVILFSISGGKLHYEGHRAADGHDLGDFSGFEVKVEDAPAFAGVMESLDTVICLRTAGELSSEIASRIGEDASRRVCLLPLLVGRAEPQRKAAAVLCAEGEQEPLDVNVLEMLCTAAGATHDCRLLAQRLTTTGRTGAILSIAPAAAAAPARGEPDWNRLSREDQELHLKAQRFARVRVAEMRLYLSQQVKEGRAQGRLYMALRGEMDRGRAQFKHEFMHSPTMVDYFHLEILRTLANDDPSLLGAEYPGPLV